MKDMLYYTKLILALIGIFILTSCDNSDYIGDDENSSARKAYIYVEDVRMLNAKEIHLIGTINDKHINRRCRTYDGYIHIGSTNLYKEQCVIDADIITTELQLFKHIKGNMKVYDL